MKKFLLILMAVTMGFGTLSLKAQSTLTVADGSDENYYVPVYGLYTDAYERSQTIYPSSMLSQMIGQAISSLTFYLSSSPSFDWDCDFEVKLVEVSDSVFNAVNFIENTSTTVYTGPLNVVNDMISLTFDVPFNYSGGNLLLEVASVNTGEYNAAAFYGIYSPLSSISGYNYSSVSDIFPGIEDFIPKTTFGYQAPSLCIKPYGLTVSNITSSDVTVSWVGNENNLSYTVQYMPATSSNWDDDAIETTVTTPSISISNLTPGTSYVMRVLATCINSTNTDWSTVLHFTMPNTSLNLPYYQDFETNPENIEDFTFQNNGPNGWFIGAATGVPSQDDTDSSVHALYISNDNGATNSYDNSSSSYAYAALDVTFDNNDMEWHLGFQYKVEGENNYDYFSVVMMDGSALVPTSGDPNGTTLLYHSSGVSNWTHFDAILENVAGTSKKIVFYWKNDGTMGTQPPVAIDNISITSFACAQPSQFEITSIGDDFVTLDWVEMGNATSWNLSYGPAGFTPGDDNEETIVVNSHPYTINNLTPAASYEFYVQSGCESNWAGPLSVIPGSFAMGVTGQDTLTTCNLVIFDNGGAEGDYINNSDYFLVIHPANPSDMIMISGLLNTESNYDYLNVYDGADTTNLLATFTGLDQTVSAISTIGPLTLYFHSDISVVKSGFQLLAECVSCFPPNHLTVSNESLTGATLTWDGIGDSYVIYLSGAVSEVYTTDNNFYTFTGLNSSAAYSVQIRSICGSDSSILSLPVSFTTTCDVITVSDANPWTENFDGYIGVGAQSLICWETPATTIFSDGTYPAVYCGYVSVCHSGANSLEFRGNGGDVNIAVFPEFTNDIHDLRLSFWATSTYANAGTMEVGVMTDPTDPTTFVLLDVCGAPGSNGVGVSGNGNYMGPFDFSGIQVPSGRIALRFTSNSYYLSWNIDDITVELIPACASPVKTSVTATVVGSDNATITWTDNNDSHNSWTVFYKPSNSANWDSIVVSTMSVALTNLTPETAYDVYVITNCGTPVDHPDATLTYHFTTSMIAVDLPYFTDFSSPNDYWLLNNGDCSNYWTIGNYGANHALFVTTDGSTPGYNANNNSIVSAEKVFTIGSDSSYNISFDVLVGGESSYDYLKVFFAPVDASYPATSASTPEFAQYSYSVNAVNFEDYLALTTSPTNPYKFNLTNGNTIHIETSMHNPNVNPTATSTAKLVFVWRNDFVTGTQPGAIISNVSIAPTICPAPSGLTASNISSTFATISWVNGDQESEWEVEYGVSGFEHGAGIVETVYNTPQYTMLNLTSGTTYDVYVRAVCSAFDTSAWVGPINVLPGAYNMPATGTQSITGCDLMIYDNGGPLENYSNNCNSILTIYPVESTYLVSIQGLLNTEDGYDFLYVYDGPDISGNLLGQYSGQNTLIPITTSTTGPLTLHFNSDHALNYSGFELAVSCIANTCPAPTNLTVSNINTTYADLSWTPGGNELSWFVEYKEASAISWIQLNAITSTSYQLDNLTPGTTYDVRLQANCGTGNQSVWIYTSFTTNCETVTEFPFIEDFEYFGNMPNCWTQEYIVGNNDWVANNGNWAASFTAHSGLFNAYFYFDSYAYPKTTKLITPIFDLTSMTSPTLTYWFSQVNWGNDQDQLRIYYRTSASSEWQLLAEHLEPVTTWTMDSLDLPNPSATYQIAFEGYATYGYGITLDDITIFDADASPYIPVDPTATTLPASAVEQTTATLNGSILNPDQVTITAKGFEWKESSAATYNTVFVTDNSFAYQLSGLTPNTEYTYRAFVTYNGSNFYGNNVTFNTLPEEILPCDVPTGLIVTSTTHESISVSWNPNPNVSNWSIQYRPENGTFSSATATTNSYTITGLAPETTYEIQVKANCSSGQSSDWSIMVTGTTGVGIDEHLLKHVNLYPNPANEVVNVECTMNNVHIEALEVFDVYGKLINTVNVIDNPTRINVSNLANGMYFVRVTTGEGTVTKSFVKK